MGKVQDVARLLLENRGDDRRFWEWLVSGEAPTMKDANKFLLGAMLNYQMRAEVAWENARRLAEDNLGDPDRLWHTIVNIPQSEWMTKRKQYRLHRFPKGHERVWTIGRRIVQYYDGDARLIWQGQSIEAVLNRLNDLQVGPQISRMIVGALFDTGQIQGKANVKVDVHLRRVLGRVFQGHDFSEQDTATVTDLTHEMFLQNPWLLDRPLYLLGKQTCRPQKPLCETCYLSEECEYRRSSSQGTALSSHGLPDTR